MRTPPGRAHRLPVWAAAALAASLILPGALLLAQGLEAVLVDVKGEVEWSPAGATQWQRAGAATVIHTGDRVRTSANSAARLAYSEGSTTLLAASTGVRVDDLTATGTGTQIKLTQTTGITQGEVNPAAAGTTYEVESPASLASAPVRTCPWVRVSEDGTTLVRNYLDMAPYAVEPQIVMEVRTSSVWLPTPAGPRLSQQSVLVPVSRTMPITRAPDEQPLMPCPFTDAASLPSDSDTLALDGTTQTWSESATPLVGSIHLADVAFEVGTRLLSQGGNRTINVRNTSGAQIQTVSLPPGQETQIAPGQSPSAPVPIGTFFAAAQAQAVTNAAQQQAQSANNTSGSLLTNAVAFGQMGTNAAIAQNIQNAQNQQPRQSTQQPTAVPAQPTVVPPTTTPLVTTQPCNATQNATGGPGIDIRTFQMGRTSGVFTFTFNAFNEADQFEIFYGPTATGTPIGGTSGFVSGSGTLSVAFGPGTSSIITVRVTGTPGSSTTIWNYTVSCPI